MDTPAPAAVDAKAQALVEALKAKVLEANNVAGVVLEKSIVRNIILVGKIRAGCVFSLCAVSPLRVTFRRVCVSAGRPPCST
jgi:hypothetical protein